MTLDLFGAVSSVDTGDRSQHDFYETPAWMTESLLTFVPEIAGARVLECASGRDAITRVLHQAGCCVFTNDIDERQPAQQHNDATRSVYWRDYAPPAAWVVSNLPFNVAFPILQLAHEHAREGVALLLRKSFIEPTEERGPWLAEYPPTRIIGLPRHSFRGAGSDSVSSDWFIWDKRPVRTDRPIVIDFAAKSRRRSA